MTDNTTSPPDAVSDSAVNLTIANMEEAIALPRKNGELVFEEPWEARAFGLAVALNEEGVYPWQDFSGGLAQTIAAAEEETAATSTESSDDSAEYYQRWLASLEELVLQQGLVTSEELEAEIAEQIHHAAHDHDHDHDHDHHH